MKLLSYLQQKGFSRRQITALIDDGNILINGEPVQAYKIELNPNENITILDKQKAIVSTFENIQLENPIKSQIVLFNKPIGYVCSKSDSHNDTIYQILPDDFKSWYYIGRLDKNSRGLLLLTNDSALVNQYEHPSFSIQKEYIVVVNKAFRDSDRLRCLDGIEYEGAVLRCLNCEVLNKPGFDISKFEFRHSFPVVRNDYTMVKFVLNEGSKRHLRRMMSELHYHVEDLVRIQEGEFVLGDIKEGEYRFA